MGYRSEVKSLVYGEPTAMAKFKSDNSELIEALEADYGSDLTQVNNGSYELIYLDCAYSKWYDSFSEIIRWENLLNLANEAELMTEFVRIDEEAGDIEQEYSQTECEYYLEVVTAIKANF